MEEIKSLENYLIQKPFWFLIEFKSDIETVQATEDISLQRCTLSTTVVSFDDLNDVNMYFEALNNQQELQYKILYSYNK